MSPLHPKGGLALVSSLVSRVPSSTSVDLMCSETSCTKGEIQTGLIFWHLEEGGNPPILCCSGWMTLASGFVWEGKRAVFLVSHRGSSAQFWPPGGCCGFEVVNQFPPCPQI